MITLRLVLLMTVSILALSADVSIAADANATSSLPLISPIFGDHMMLQRDKPNMLWGWSKPGDTIRIEVAGESASATADETGRWQATIDPPPVGGPYTLRISGPQNLELHDVLVGDVWLCGGQSNMEFALEAARNGPSDVKSANVPQMRLFKVASQVSYSSAKVPQGKWEVCSPATAGRFSAVAYFFGRRLHESLHIPIGLVEDCVGGTPAETWTSRDALKSLGGFDAQFAEMDQLARAGGPEYGNYIMHWYDQYDIGQKNNWSAADFDDSSWKTVHIPGGFAELGVPETAAVCWFRKEIDLPSPVPEGHTAIFLGSIEQMDTVFINGHWTGASAWVENPRVYTIAPGILKPGRNVIALRVFKVKKDGGFLSKPGVLRLVVGKTEIPLAGEWKGALSVDARPPHEMPLSFENWPTMPSVLYQGMLEPIAPLAIKGAIWYQGEANTGRATEYHALLTAMIGDWRRLFAQGDFPFYIVSLPAFMHRRDEPGSDGWTELREAQILTAETVAHSGVAITLDTGEPDNIHPRDKEIVGQRLALCALARTYDQNVIYQGPTFTSLDRLPGALRLHFAHTDGGLVAKGGAPKEFSVAGPDHKWHWADARIEGDTIVVSSPQVPDPRDVRYAWQSNPVANVYNGAGLPAVPFRTDP